MDNIEKPKSQKRTSKVDAFSLDEQIMLLEKFNDSKYKDLFTIATRCIEAKMPAEVLQKLLGH